jgi:hypothetical protein
VDILLVHCQFCGYIAISGKFDNGTIDGCSGLITGAGIRYSGEGQTGHLEIITNCQFYLVVAGELRKEVIGII